MPAVSPSASTFTVQSRSLFVVNVPLLVIVFALNVFVVDISQATWALSANIFVGSMRVHRITESLYGSPDAIPWLNICLRLVDSSLRICPPATRF